MKIGAAVLAILLAFPATVFARAPIEPKQNLRVRPPAVSLKLPGSEVEEFNAFRSSAP